MRQSHFILPLSPSVLAVLLSMTSCSETDPKVLTDRAATATNSGDWTSGLAGYEDALAHMEASNAQYLRASVGRCQALARLDPKKGKIEFLALAKAQASKIQPQDFHVVASEFLHSRLFLEAIDVMHAGMTMFPESPKMALIKDFVVAESLKAADPAINQKLSGLGYVGKQ